MTVDIISFRIFNEEDYGKQGKWNLSEVKTSWERKRSRIGSKQNQRPATKTYQVFIHHYISGAAYHNGYVESLL